MPLDILLVEDDLDLAETIVLYCDIEGISCDHAANGLRGLTLVEQNSYQVIVLDVNLPRMSGLSVCETLRQRGVDTPIVMLTARTTLQDKLAGFQSGADDYLTKPFEMAELIARIYALSSRRSGQAQKLILGPLELDLTRRQAYTAGNPLKLSKTGWILLETLVRESPLSVSRQTLERAIWGDDIPESNSLNVHIFNLRKRLEQQAPALTLATLPGVGFALVEAASL